jgi:hypothetical protein
MVFLSALWIPILVSAAVVFVASSIVHMVLPFHKNDLRRLPSEDEVLEALRKFDLPPGDYGAPHPGSMAGMKDPAFIEKRKRGPIVYLTVARAGTPSMGKSLALWFLYCAVVSLFGAYVAGRALAPSADYLSVFRFVGVTTFLGYSLALAQHSIWAQRSWGTTVRSMIDGLLYGLLTAGIFGWLWPG